MKWMALAQRHRLPAVCVDSVSSVARSELAEIITDDCCTPPLPGLPHDDMGAVLRIARSVNPRLICEIGTAYGNLAANLLRNCPLAFLITVNALKEQQTGAWVTYHLSDQEIGRVYREYGFQDRVTQIFCNSLKLALSQYMWYTSIDLAILDGCHDTEFVLNDFEKVQRDHLAGSYRACLLLRERGYDVKWIEGTWWGYWQVGRT